LLLLLYHKAQCVGAVRFSRSHFQEQNHSRRNLSQRYTTTYLISRHIRPYVKRKSQKTNHVAGISVSQEASEQKGTRSRLVPVLVVFREGNWLLGLLGGGIPLVRVAALGKFTRVLTPLIVHMRSGSGHLWDLSPISLAGRGVLRAVDRAATGVRGKGEGPVLQTVTSGGDILPSADCGVSNMRYVGGIVEARDSSGLVAGSFHCSGRATNKRLVSGNFLVEVPALQLDFCDQKTRTIRERELIGKLPQTRCRLRYRWRRIRRRAQCRDASPDT